MEEQAGGGQEDSNGNRSSEDIFLSLAQNESGSNDEDETATQIFSRWQRRERKSKRPSLPAPSSNRLSVPTSNVRPRLSDASLAYTYTSSSPVAADEARPRYRSQLYAAEPSGLDARNGSRLSAVTRQVVRSRLNVGSRAPSEVGSAYQDRRANPETPRFERREPSVSSYEALSQPRFSRLNGHDTLRGGTNHHDSMNIPLDLIGKEDSQAKSDSVDSTAAPSTVWDELDELKSRMKRLESTGRMPPTSGAAVASHANNRPRTGTTAPTVISSSPRQIRKPGVAPSEVTVGGPNAATLYPLLHSALAKSKMLLNPQLYRALEASASDALALAVISGSGGPQGTTFSAASIINGVTVSDRHVRRKADSMCRNLTDLCIALCEGKGEASLARSSPISLRSREETPFFSRHARSNTQSSDLMSLPGTDPRYSSGRFAARTESRRSSILSLSNHNPSSPLQSSELSSETDRSPSIVQKDYTARYTRPGTALMRTRYSRFDEDAPEDPMGRAASRATTEVGQSRNMPSQLRDYAISGHQGSPSLREVLAARRANGVSHDSVRSDAQPAHYIPQGAPERSPARKTSQMGESSLSFSDRKRRVASMGHYEPTPIGGHTPVRTSSLNRSTNIAVE